MVSLLIRVSHGTDDTPVEADGRLAIDLNDSCLYILQINFYMEFAADWILF